MSKSENYNPRLRDYASSAAFRLELSAGMIEFLLWLQENPQSIETCGDIGNPRSWSQHPAVHRGTILPALERRGLIQHRYVEDQPKGTPAHKKLPGLFLTGPNGEGFGHYEQTLTTAGKLVAFLLREAGWAPRVEDERPASSRRRGTT